MGPYFVHIASSEPIWICVLEICFGCVLGVVRGSRISLFVRGFLSYGLNCGLSYGICSKFSIAQSDQCLLWCYIVNRNVKTIWIVLYDWLMDE